MARTLVVIKSPRERMNSTSVPSGPSHNIWGANVEIVIGPYTVFYVCILTHLSPN
jgi:hypothetical protein